MDPCCCYVCSPCPQRAEGCPEEMRCRYIPPCNMFVPPCHPCDSNIFQSPICNKQLIKKGATNGKRMFCVKRQEMKYYTTD